MPVTMSSTWQRPLLLWAETIISRVWQPDVHCIRTRWNSDQYGLRARGGAVDRVCAHLRMPFWVYGYERVHHEHVFCA